MEKKQMECCFKKNLQNVVKKRAVKLSDFLIADNPGIEDYYRQNYGVNNIKYIAYGAELFDNPNIEDIKEFNLEPYQYYMLIARLEPENNIEMLLDGYLLSNAKEPFIVVGGLDNKYVKYLLEKYKNNDNIKFVGGIYDYKKTKHT